MENIHQNIFTIISEHRIWFREFSCFSSLLFHCTINNCPVSLCVAEIHFLWKETLLLHSVGVTV